MLLSFRKPCGKGEEILFLYLKSLYYFWCYWQQDLSSATIYIDLSLKSSQLLPRALSTSFIKYLTEWPAKSSCINFQWPKQVVRDPIMTLNTKWESCRLPDPTISPPLCFVAGLFTMITLSWNYKSCLLWQSLLNSRTFGSFQVQNICPSEQCRKNHFWKWHILSIRCFI